MIPEPVIDLLQTGVSIVVGTRDASLVPECTRAWGIRVSKDGRSVTVFLTETISRKTLQNLRDNGQVAISCARPTDHMACQLKGRLRAIRPAGARDRDCRSRWAQDFREELIAIGVPALLFDALIRDPALAVDIDVTDVFHQTPGPGGRREALTMIPSTPTLETLWPCLQGIIPAAMSTCSRDGTPNITFVSQVTYVDASHVAISFQFFNKTHRNVREHPFACAMIVDPRTLQAYRLALRFDHSESTGPCSNRCRCNCKPSRRMRG